MKVLPYLPENPFRPGWKIKCPSRFKSLNQTQCVVLPPFLSLLNSKKLSSYLTKGIGYDWEKRSGSHSHKDYQGLLPLKVRTSLRPVSVTPDVDGFRDTGSSRVTSSSTSRDSTRTSVKHFSSTSSPGPCSHTGTPAGDRGGAPGGGDTSTTRGPPTETCVTGPRPLWPT